MTGENKGGMELLKQRAVYSWPSSYLDCSEAMAGRWDARGDVVVLMVAISPPCTGTTQSLRHG